MKLLVNGMDLKLDGRCLSNYVKNHIIGIESDYTYKFKLLKTNKMNYEITEEQIKELAKGNAKVKKMFPNVFETKLEVDKWYKDNSNSGSKYLVYVSEAIGKMNENQSILGYGFSDNGDWAVYDCNRKAGSNTISLATDSEVLEALTNEAKKKGFKKGVYVNRDMLLINKGTVKITSNDDFVLFGVNNCSLQLGGNCIFENGKWAKPIKTYTKEEAEKMLNAKII